MGVLRRVGLVCVFLLRDNGRPLRGVRLAHDAGEFNVWIGVPQATIRLLGTLILPVCQSDECVHVQSAGVTYRM